MKRKILFFCLGMIISLPTWAQNRFSDQEELQRIYTLQNNRNTEALLRELANPKAECREMAVLAFASSKDTIAFLPLIELLGKEKDEKVKNNILFSLGQIGIYARKLIDFYVKNEKTLSISLKNTCLESIGKCVSSEMEMNFLADIPQESSIDLGIIKGIFRASLRHKPTEGAAKRCFEALQQQNSAPETKEFASHFFARNRTKINLSSYAKTLLEILKKEKNYVVRMNLALTLGENTGSHTQLVSYLGQEKDYRVKVAILRALQKADYSTTKNAIQNLIFDANANVSYTTAQFFRANARTEDASLYVEWSKKIKNSRTQAEIIGAAIRHKNSDAIAFAKEVLADAKKSAYTRGFMANALAEDISQYPHILQTLKQTQENLLKTYCMEALCNIRQHKEWNTWADASIQAQFGDIFRMGILSGDEALAALSAGILQNPDFNYKTYFKDYSFLKEGLATLALPNDIETYIEIQKTLFFFEGKQEDNPLPPIQRKETIDWKKLASIPTHQKLLLKTTKGNITIQVNVDTAPTTVLNILSLAENGYYNGKFFHRVVANFVAQVGCPRGDGWGSTPDIIRSEFTTLGYEEGTIGMASAGTDTESCQFFIMHNPMPHLDGRYTVFGKVINGIEVLHLLDIGDKIKKVIILRK